MVTRNGNNRACGSRFDPSFDLRNTALVVLLLLCLPGCDNRPDPQLAAAPVISNQSTAELWSRSCALCHVDGTASAPRIGNAQEWQPRLAKGRDVLLTHTLEGFGKMPPLGYCMACEHDDFVALIDFMTDGVSEVPQS